MGVQLIAYTESTVMKDNKPTMNEWESFPSQTRAKKSWHLRCNKAETVLYLQYWCHGAAKLVSMGNPHKRQWGASSIHTPWNQEKSGANIILKDYRSSVNLCFKQQQQMECNIVLHLLISIQRDESLLDIAVLIIYCNLFRSSPPGVIAAKKITMDHAVLNYALGLQIIKLRQY